MVDRHRHPGGTLRVANARLLIILVLLTLFSTLPWVASMFMPDIFTPLTVLSLACLTLSWDDFSRRQRFALLIVFGASIVMHVTNLPMAIALTVVAMAMQWKSLWVSPQRWLAVIVAGGVAVAAMLFVSVVGFGKWSVAPQNPPILLARSVADGPGKLYLQEHCPQINLVMCNHLDRLEGTFDDFVWHANGVFANVSPAEQDLIRTESATIAIHAAIEHPWLQLRASASDFLEQLTSFSLRDTRFPNSAKITRTEMLMAINDEAFSPWLVALSVVDYVSVLASCFALVWVWRTLSTRNKQLAVLLLLAVILNSATGVLGMPVSRYGARIMWLVPLTALILVPSKLSVRRQLPLAASR
jgi:hypothetical protein